MTLDIPLFLAASRPYVPVSETSLFSHFNADASWNVLLIAAAVLTLIVHLAFALGIFADARRMSEKRIGPFWVSSHIWALAVFLGGLMTVVVYWGIHYSILRRNSPTETALGSDAPPTPTASSKLPADY